MKKLTTGILMGFFAVMGLAHAENNRYHPNHLFIKMKAGEELVKSPLIKSSKNLFGNLYLVKTSSADKLVKELNGSENIEYVQKDFFAEKRPMPKHEVLDEAGIFLKNLQNFDFSTSFNDPDASRLWAFNASAGLDVIGAYDNLPAYQPKEVIVAVVDTGVDHNHEDLRDVMWTNEREIPGNGKDDDNNGYIDDIHGINTLVRDAQGRATMDTMASHWHGTHVAGTIAATQNNGIGIAGVANNVKIMAIRTVPDDSDELDSDIVEGFLYAAKMGAKVINCSFGKKNNEGGMVVRDTINKISRKGVLVVISAGNDSMGPFSWHNNDVNAKYPASFDSANTLVIASTTSSGGFSTFSNIGPVTVDVASPGSNIYSTINSNRYSMASGTSMAAPNASGVAAMVMGYYPNLKNTTVKRVLMNTVTPVAEFKGKIVSGGRLNLRAALEKAKTLKR
ncbi:MAG: S8 family peptidase [Bacteriovoracia bacterium]